MFRLFFLTLIITPSLSAFADCEKEYNKFKLIAVAQTVTTPVNSGLYLSAGALSSSGATLAALLSMNFDLSTAGILYGAAFTYEGTHFITATISNFKKFKGRSHALKLIVESKIGFGDTLEEFIDDVNEELSEYTELSKEEVIDEVIFGNSTLEFCQTRDTMFTLNNIKNYIARKYIPSTDIEPNYDDDLDIDIIDGGYEY